MACAPVFVLNKTHTLFKNVTVDYRSAKREEFSVNTVTQKYKPVVLFVVKVFVMRDQLNFNSFNLLPIVKDDRNDLTITTCIKGYAPNISNGYYGFQPAVQNKNERHEREQQQQHERMDVTENEIQRPLNCCRKRAWNCENDVDFKRRRENGLYDVIYI